MPDTQDLILTELRSLREDFNQYARETGERLATLETDNHSLMGNGQPGRIAQIEKSVSKLSRWRWWMVGAAAGCSATVSAIAWVFVEVVKGK